MAALFVDIVAVAALFFDIVVAFALAAEQPVELVAEQTAELEQIMESVLDIAAGTDCLFECHVLAQRRPKSHCCGHPRCGLPRKPNSVKLEPFSRTPHLWPSD